MTARSPTIVVGDNRGAVTVYRVLDPITVTHEGPQQQMAKLKQVRTCTYHSIQIIRACHYNSFRRKMF